MTAAEERRAAPRAPLSGGVTVSWDGGRIEAESVDISQSGIAVRMPASPAPGTWMRLSFRIAQDGGLARLDADGTVARVEPGRGGALGKLAVGVQFEVVEAQVIEAIHRHVLRHGARTVANGPAPGRRSTDEYAPADRYPAPSVDDSEKIPEPPPFGVIGDAGSRAPRLLRSTGR